MREKLKFLIEVEKDGPMRNKLVLKGPLDNTVALVRYRPDANSLAKALDLCQGLQGVSTRTQILIKPNLVFWDDSLPFPPYGVLTTTRMVEALIVYLEERDYKKITIGEGTMRHQQTNISTQTVYHRLGYHRFINRYGVKLIDFFDEPFVPVKQDGVRMGIAKSALEAEFLITLPALKTHTQTKVSLGIKNLKGAVDMKTRRLFHSSEVDLDHCIALLGQLLEPDLNIIDGIYGLEQGPFFFGQAIVLMPSLFPKILSLLMLEPATLSGSILKKSDIFSRWPNGWSFQWERRI